jgi:leucyl aminopeptidase
MKLVVEKTTSKGKSPMQILFFDKNKKLLNTKYSASDKEELKWLEATIQNQAKEKTDYLSLFSKEKKFFVVNLQKIKSFKDFLHTGGKIGKEIFSEKGHNLDILFFDKPAVKLELNYAVESFLEGLMLGSYRYHKFQKNIKEKLPQQIHLFSDFEKIKIIATKAAAIAEACTLAKDCANSPANYFYPEMFVEEAKKIAKGSKIKTTFLDEKKLKKLKMNCILGVSAGSEKEAYLVVMEYYAPKKTKETLLLVGKGLTFDCGGISIKPSANMDEMKFDMCGGAAVLGTMKAVAKLQPDINIIALIPTSENLVNGSALKPGDVLTAYNGKTIEVDNTDAEGRLILADALAYGVKNFKPSAVIDLATLTGACVVALGHHYSGMMSNNDHLSSQLEKAGVASSDKVWRLPATEEYQRQIKGKQTDLNNIGGRGGGTITAGMFLKNFVADTPWAHLDIAGTAWTGKQAHHTKGATAVGVRLLCYLIEHWQKLNLNDKNHSQGN